MRSNDVKELEKVAEEFRKSFLKGVTKSLDRIFPMACPSDGAFIGWKKARHCGEAVLVKLLITEDAKRSSATGRKCRCDKARVIEILSMKDNKELESAVSDYNSSFVYKKGETVREPNFCEDRFNECAEGIHFFIDRKEAENYLP